MKTATIFLIASLGVAHVCDAQSRFFTRDGQVSFFSSTPVEDIEAINHKMTCVLDESTGDIEFAVLIKSFEFEKALMEEHFNENYMESSKFPKATFRGTIKEFDLMKESNFPPGVEHTVNGTMEIHGVQQDITVMGYISKSADGYTIESTFIVKPEDYDIEIPNTVRENIAKEITVMVDAKLAPLTK